MLPLKPGQNPKTSEELRTALEVTLKDVVEKAGSLVSIVGDIPDIESLAIDLSGASISEPPPRPELASGKTHESLTTKSFRLDGSNISLFGTRADLVMNATDLRVDVAAATRGNRVLVFRHASSGDLRLAISKASVEQLIRAIGKREASKHGVALDDVSVNWKPRGERGVDLDVHVKARKFFMSASLALTGSVDVDEKLGTRLSNLHCRGEGAIAGMACAMLQPHLERVNGRTFSLRSLPIGDMAVRDLQVNAGDPLEIRATFGAP